ncbi:CMP-N-acetylneuraminate-beta-galactosamide-alpha-2,3-sialyltransferase 1-like isoform X2 [Paramisgurnus dabryanus]|uniref:CMP-N-acetylneuraminate-beta-galactosamide- alpha-2,3-sialyltransferase 1-like isoform X2 n=1 Tax=Paramisgurnus dabryanus TaxID=90735 RepID=UPI003CCF550D
MAIFFSKLKPHHHYVILLLSFTIILCLYIDNSRVSKPAACVNRTCAPDTERTNWFCARFAPTVQLLLNSRNSRLSADVSSWWRGLQNVNRVANYTTLVKNLFQLFPNQEHCSGSHPNHCRTCAVVGNSGNLLGSRYGPLIDSKDCVMRTYTDVPSTINGNKDKVMILHPEFMKYVHVNWTEYHGSYPSTGFLMVIFALHICDEVHVFGFGATKDGNWHHYFDKTLTPYANESHAGDFEYKTISRLHWGKNLLMYKGWT